MLQLRVTVCKDFVTSVLVIIEVLTTDERKY